LDERARRREVGWLVVRRGYQHIIDLEARFADEFGHEEYETVRRVLERLVPCSTNSPRNDTSD
jgi:hypothetical protein